MYHLPFIAGSGAACAYGATPMTGSAFLFSPYENREPFANHIARRDGVPRRGVADAMYAAPNIPALFVACCARGRLPKHSRQSPGDRWGWRSVRRLSCFNRVLIR